MSRKPYPSDLDDETHIFMLPYFTLLPADAPQRIYPIREMLNATLWMGRTGSQWRYLAHDLQNLSRQEAQRNALPMEVKSAKEAKFMQL